MCGIAGSYLNSPANQAATITEMTHSLEHRGPDGFGFIDLTAGQKASPIPTSSAAQSPSKVVFGHRRLSIIDLEGSSQPLCNEDGSVWVTFNGEIYNYPELRQLLKQKGHQLRSAGDTEVLVHLWEEFGPEMVNHLNGMFAFAIYDTKSDRLFLARDRFGEKPLYYFVKDDTFYFASELHAFWACEKFSANINHAALGEYFRHAYIPSPLTIYEHTYSLPAGHCLEIKGKIASLNVKAYWQPMLSDHRPFIAEEFEALLQDAVKIRLKADVPIGLFLSGGLDSSVIAATASRCQEQALKTFTVNTYDHDTEEVQLAGDIARHLKCEHTLIQAHPDFALISEQLAKNYGQPFADYSSVPTYLVSKQTRRSVKVALSGDGGDELFFGYERYFTYSLLKKLSYVPETFKRLLAGGARALHSNDQVSHYYDLLLSSTSPWQKGQNRSHMFHDYWQRKIFNQDFAQTLSLSAFHQDSIFLKHQSSAQKDLPFAWGLADQKMYLPDDILTKVDVASMANSLECRAPFLDYRIADYVNSVRHEEKVENGKGKKMLRDIARKRLPAKTLSLKKTGFSMPLANWLRQDLKDWANSLLFDGHKLWESFLNKSMVQEMWTDHQNEKYDHSMRLWQVLSISLWEQQLKSSRKNRL